MNPTLVLEYSTEGGVHVVADLEAAAHWRGSEDDGSGVSVDYLGPAVVKLPDAFFKVKKPGRHTKKFADLAEAQAFEAKLVKEFEKAAPEATRPRPDQPIYNIGQARVFSIEISFHSMVDGVYAKMKGGAHVLPFGKKKTQGIFFEVEDGGRGVIVANSAAGSLIVSKFHHSGTHDKTKVSQALAAMSVPKSKAKLKLAERVLFFPAAASAAELAQANWKSASLIDSAASAFAGMPGGSLRVPDQDAGGAFVRLPAGEYEISYVNDATVGAIGANVLWCVKR
jgi:hypothetical protein